MSDMVRIGNVFGWSASKVWRARLVVLAALTLLLTVGVPVVSASATTPPTITEVTGPAGPVQVEAFAAVEVTFDTGTASSYEVTWAWGDNSSSAQLNATSPVTDFHNYLAPGVYSVTVTVEGDDGGSDTDTFEFIAVYDPAGGFATGGGSIDSPAGAFVADPALSGKANFGFVSKYKKGASTPSGNTEFQFKAGDLNFHSVSYDWLVIAGQDKAKYKGTGTINGAGNYGFMLTAVDNGNIGDTFRIKIWDKDAGDAVVYDNKLGSGDDDYDGTAIGGGSIKVHKK